MRRLAGAKHVHRALASALLAACAACTVSACGGGSSGSSPMPTGAAAHDAELLDGRSVFAAHCATCHGTAGGGGLGPKFSDGRLLRDFPGIDAQIRFVEHGKGVMPAWQHLLSAAQIRAVVRYERELLSGPSSAGT